MTYRRQHRNALCLVPAARVTEYIYNSLCKEGKKGKQSFDLCSPVGLGCKRWIAALSSVLSSYLAWVARFGQSCLYSNARKLSQQSHLRQEEKLQDEWLFFSGGIE
jgi:hypothetical protein